MERLTPHMTKALKGPLFTWKNASDLMRTAQGAALAMVLSLCAASAFARDVPVSNAEELQAALQEAGGGDRLLLQAGNYGRLSMWPGGKIDPRFDGTVTIQSADPKQPAVFTELDLSKARNIVFQNLVFDFQAEAGKPSYHRSFEIKNSADIAVLGSLFDGDDAHGVGPKADGYPTGIGLSLRKSDRIRVENNVFRNFYRGLTVGQSDGSIVRGNDISGIRSDCMTFVQVTNLLIENNHLHDFRRSPTAGDHADMIQFWTYGTKIPTSNVTIRGNVLNIGSGDDTQSLFMRNEAVDSQDGGKLMYYRDILIEDNIIINGHLHGITIGETNGLTIRNNTLIRVPRTGPAKESIARGSKTWMPRINVSKNSVNVTLEGNIAPKIKEQPGWKVENNLAIQDTSLMEPGHYTRVFQNGLADKPYAVENYIAKPGGPADRPGLGAARLSRY